MAKGGSPYPHISLEKALERARKIFDEDRTNTIDRKTAAMHVGYSSVSGASDKMLGTLSQYGLLEPAGKGQTKLTSLALDIFAPESEASKRSALYKAGSSPTLFGAINSAFETTPSKDALRNWMIRQDISDNAMTPASKAYFQTFEYLERQEAIESGGPLSGKDANLDGPDGNGVVYGGAKVGDLVQWEVDGILRLEKPLTVRRVTPDGEWIAVEGSETGIPMSQVIVQSGPKHTLPPLGSVPAPIFPIEQNDTRQAISDEPNQIKIIQNGDSLSIHCDNVTAKGLRALRKKLEMYSSILEMEIDIDDF